MSLEIIRAQVEYHFWATRRLLGGMVGLDQEQFTRHVESGFPSIQATLAHMISGDIFFSRLLDGEPSEVIRPEELPDVPSALARWEPLEQRFQAYMAVLDRGEMNRHLEIRIKTGAVELQVWHILHQMVAHGNHHRGQLTTMLRQVGAEPAVATDPLFFYLERGRG